jgi:hypothetical protein
MVHTPQYRKGDRRPGPYRRRGIRPQKQAAMRPSLPASNGFLSHSFGPVVMERHPELHSKAAVEKEFFQSLGYLAAFYKLSPLMRSGIAYPYNLHIAFEDAKAQMTAMHRSIELEVVQDATHQACIATRKELDTGYSLYYIPVKPVCLLLKDKKQKDTANLLLALFGILYHKGVASFRDCGSFLFCHYEMLFEWLEENPDAWDKEDYLAQRSGHRAQAWHGDKLFRQVRHAYHSSRFNEYVRDYRPRSQWQQEAKGVCEQFCDLFTRFPDRDFYSQITTGYIDGTSEEVYPGSYLSFFWAGDDRIYQGLMETINTALQECTHTLGPTAIQLFDGPQQAETHDFYFEHRFLLLIDSLCTLLFNMP